MLSTSHVRHFKEKSFSFSICLVFIFLSPLSAKAVRSAWRYLCGVIQRSIWMEMGEFSLSVCDPCCTAAAFNPVIFPFLPNTAATPAIWDDTQVATLCSGEWPSVLFAPQGLHCEHSKSDSCLQTCVGAGYVVSNKQPLEPQWLSKEILLHDTPQISW